MSNKVYNIIESQLPQFIRDDSNYDKFIDFLKDYYKFLGNIDISTARDVDQSEYIEHIISEYARNFQPIQLLEDKQQSVVIKNLINLYKSKGSYNSYSSIFSILYNKDLEIFLPSTQIFKPSSATWNRDVSIRFVIDTGLLSSFDGFPVKIITNAGRELNLNVLKVIRVKNTPNIFEAVLDTKSKITIKTGGTISGTGFTGTLVSTITNKRVISGGKGFVVGDTFDVVNSGGSGTKFKVTRVNSNTGIMSFQIVEFGNGYSSSFQTEIQPKSSISVTDNRNLVITSTNDLGQVIQTQEVSSDDSVNKFIDELLITKFDYVDNPNYFQDNTYTGLILNQTDSETISTVSGENNSALIFFELGYVLEYPGYYSTNIGFTSDASFLQDGEYYQQFSYVIKSTEQYETYSNILKSLVHPAGMKMFSEYTIEKQLDILVNIESVLSLLEFNILDIISSDDNVDSKTVIKNIFDDVQMLELMAKDMSRIITESISISDSHSISYTKNISDVINTIDEIIERIINKNIFDSVDLLDLSIKTINKDIQETSIAVGYGCSILNDGYYLFDDLISNNGGYWECGYAVDETVFEDMSYFIIDDIDSMLSDGNGNLITVNG